MLGSGCLNLDWRAREVRRERGSDFGRQQWLIPGSAIRHSKSHYSFGYANTKGYFFDRIRRGSCGTKAKISPHVSSRRGAKGGDPQQCEFGSNLGTSQ